MRNDSVRLALQTSVTYLFFGFLWIALSDNFLALFFRNHETFLHLQTYKGWFFVLITALLLFIVLRNRLIELTSVSIENARAKKLIEESETKYRELVENSPDAIAIYAEGKMVYVNNASVLLMGARRKEELIGQSAVRFVHPDSLPLVQRRMAETANSQTVLPAIEEKFLRLDGGTVDVEVKAIPLTFDGKPAVQIIARDITERKVSEEIIRQSEKKFSDLFNRSPLVHALTTLKTGVYLEVNNSFLDTLGYTRRELIGHSSLDLRIWATPEDRRRIVESVAATGYVTNLEINFRRKNGEVFPGLLSMTAVMIGGEECILSIASDISEIKNIQTALKKSEERNRALVETIPDLLFVQTIDGVYLDYHAPSDDDLLIPPSVFLGKNMRDVLPKEIVDGFLPKFRAAIETKQIQHYEYSLPFRGVITYFEARLIASGDNTIITMIRNTTEQRNAIENVRINQRRLQRAEVVARFGNWELNLATKTMHASEGAKKLYGVAGGAEWKYDIVQQVPLPEYRNVLDDALEGLIADQKPYDIEFKIARLSDGAVLDIHSIAEYDAEKNIVFGVIHDITERKKAETALEESELRYRALFNTTDDNILIHTIGRNGLPGKYIEVNDSTCRSLGYTREELLAMGPSDTTDLTDKYLLQKIGERFARKESVMFEANGMRKDGTVIPFEIRAQVFRLGRQDVVFAVSRDITERKNAEHQITRLNTELERRVEQRTAELTAANKELEAFSYSVSHDLRAPLRAVDAFSSMLMDQYASLFDNEGKRLLVNIRSSIERMDLLIDGLLTLSRIGRTEMRRTTVNMTAFVKAIFREIVPQENLKNISFTVETLPGASVDPILIRQVWTNLLSNAVKYSRYRETPVIIVRGNDAGGTLTYSVQDNGAGFNQENANKLFGIFQRLHSGKEFQGVGIGLSIVKRIVQRHGGAVWAEGKENEGAVFSFSLPSDKEA